MAKPRLGYRSWSLLALAALLFAAIGVLLDWGGRIEAALMVFGTPVFISLDAARPSSAILLALPIALVAAAFALRKP